MYKVTTFILLYLFFQIFSQQIQAQNPDIDLLKQINGNSSTGLRDYSKFISNTTTIVGVSTPIVLGVTALITHDDNMLKNGIYVGASIAVDAVLTYGLKDLINRPRPYVTYPDEITPYSNPGSASFPSGHTSFAFATATALSLKYPKWYIIAPSYLWACSVGYSRMNLGVHYPTDVLAGAILGAGSAYLTSKVNDWFWKKTGNKKLISLKVYQ